MITKLLEKSVREACIAEARAPKPGNVHPGASFDDLHFDDFVSAAEAIAPVIARSFRESIGRTILDATRATCEQTRTNANLGIILLLVPLSKAVTLSGMNSSSLAQSLDSLTVEDARLTYQAIRLATPGGMGKESEQDVRDEPTVTLKEAMQLAAHRDSVARQYVSQMTDVVQFGPKVLSLAIEEAGCSEEEAIVWCHLHFMAKYPDSLISRKLGEEVARESQARAQAIISIVGKTTSGTIPSPCPGFLKHPMLIGFDAWLRDDGHKKNPGTSADLVAASLFVRAVEQNLPPVGKVQNQ